MEQPLHIYQASAGSGKTFNIARQFLKLCLRNPESKGYRRILAITFTNKATAEMKSRFLKELRVLAHGQNSAHLDELMKWLQLDEVQVRATAKQVLRQILHDYHHLSVMTIDSFFQRVLRAFALDMKLAGNFETEMQQSVVTEFAVRELLERSTHEPEVFERLIQLLVSRMEEGASWNFHQSLQAFTGELMREEVDLINRPTDFEEKIENIINDSEKLKKEEVNALLPHAEMVKTLWERYSLSNADFHLKTKGIKAFLEEVVAGKLPVPMKEAYRKVLEDLTDWSDWIRPKSVGYENVHAALEEGLGIAAQSIMQIQDAYGQLTATYREILSQSLALKFLPLLAEALRAFPAQTGKLPQSDVARMINALIANHDSSFLLERAGTRYRHYLLDEFQDTSRLQWENLRPLITESVASGHFSMVVGDVKQAIYRWRNGDWRLLGGDIQRVYEGQCRNASLLVNFRSAPAIIAFNNQLFPLLAKAFYADLQQEVGEVTLPKEAKLAFQHFYSTDLMNQLLPEKKKGEPGGYVSITLTDEEIANPLDWLIQQVLKALQAGFKAGDIAVLVRKNDQAAQVALHLLQNQFDAQGEIRWAVLTEEALKLKQSAEVRAIMAVCKMYVAFQSGQRNLLAEMELAACLSTPNNDWEAPIKPDFSSIIAEFPNWNNLLIADFVAAIIVLLNLQANVGAHPYLMMFEEEVRTWAIKNHGEISKLIAWWEEKGAETKVLTATAINAISIMTIHQSKGLEFPVVLLPFLGEKIDDSTGLKGTNLWEDVSDFTQIETGTLPIRYKQDLQKTVLKDLYLREKSLRYMDMLNLVYVAFTRPCEWLCGYAELPGFKQDGTRKKGNWINLFEAILPDLGLIKEEHCPEGIHHFQLGNPWKLATYSSGNAAVIRINEYPLFPIPEFNRLNHDSESGNQGRLLHQFLSQLNQPQQAIAQLKQWPPYLQLNQKSQEELFDQLSQLIEMKEFDQLFDEAAEILVERDFFSPEGILRPDRVVIGEEKALVVDFKTGIQRPEHEQQVSRYAHYLKELLEKPVTGLLLYTQTQTAISIV